MSAASISAFSTRSADLDAAQLPGRSAGEIDSACPQADPEGGHHTQAAEETVEKGAGEYLRVLKDEADTTNRAEQEITRRASSKNDYSIDHSDALGLGGKVHFGQEASKSSDDIKKSFHEAVFKSAQEFAGTINRDQHGGDR